MHVKDQFPCHRTNKGIIGRVLTFLYKGFNIKRLGLNINLTSCENWSCQSDECHQQNGAYCQQKFTYLPGFYAAARYKHKSISGIHKQQLQKLT